MTGILPVLLGATPAAMLLVIYFLVRDWLDRRRAHWESRWKKPEEDGPALAELAAGPPPGLRGRIDHGFQEMMHRTGLRIGADQAVALMFLAGVLLAGVLVLWHEELWLAGVGLLAGILIPLAFFRYRQGRWRRRIQDQLPDAFFLLARSLRAGLSLEEALATVGEHGLQPIAGEFQRCLGHLQLGMTVTGALQILAQRLQLVDLNGLVTIVSLHRTTGGNLPFLLDRWAATTRDRNQFRGFFRAATAYGRITAVALGAAPLLLLLGYWLLQPDYLILFAQSASGPIALGVAAALEVIGTLWLLALTRVDY
jgi:tight adherence protein B